MAESNKDWDNNYSPLHKDLRVMYSEECSKISGKDEDGLFAIGDILPAADLGISHQDSDPSLGYHMNLVRWPLGGHINHSDEPNCMIEPTGDGRYRLITLRFIESGDELFVDYTKFNCGNRDCAK